jgi:acetyl esterase/lipase
MSGFDAKKLGTIQLDVVYNTQDENVQRMDIYYPSTIGPWPALVFVHGGGWSDGDKTWLVFNASQYGYLMASINYRMYPAARFPAMIEDVKCAIRYLRAHASQYNLDPGRIGVSGHSAGGHLASLAGLAGPDAGWDVGPYLDQSSRVQAVIPISGPSDLLRPFEEQVRGIIDNAFGPQQLVSGSPLTYVHPNAPPFLIVHGDQDDVVPVGQAYLLHDALARMQVPAELLILHNGGHGLEPVGGPLEPPVEKIYQWSIEFLDHHLMYSGSI